MAPYTVCCVQTFFYMAGMQLLASGGVPTLVLGVSGLFAGLLYRLDVLGIKRVKVSQGAGCEERPQVVLEPT